MSNLFDNTDDNDSRKADQDSTQEHDDTVLTERELPDPSVSSTTPDPSGSLENRTFPENEPEISHFLKNKADAEVQDANINILDTASVVQGVGRMLRQAREARKLSIEEVSRQLRISVQQVDAIEKEDFDALPGRTFVRGFVRNYANLMQLDANAAVRMLPGFMATATHAAHHANHAEQAPFKIQEMALSSREKQGSGNFLRIMVLLIVLAAVGYFLYEKSPLWRAAEENIHEKEQVVQRSDGQAAVELQLALPALKLSASPAESARLNSGGRAPESIVTQLPMANLNTVGTLFFNFTADTHIKVIDGNDDVIFDQRNARGTQQRVSGKRPLSVSIGKASAVELNYNDRAVDISPYTHPTKGSAHLMLE